MSRARPYRSFSFLLSCCFHGGLLVFLLWESRGLFSSAPSAPPAEQLPPVMNPPPINATVVDQRELNHEIRRLEAAEAQKKAMEAERLNRLAVKASEMEKKRAEEEEKLRALKLSTAEAAKAQAEVQKKTETERLHLKALEAQKAEALKKQAEEQTRLQALAKKRAKEEEKAKELARQKAVQVAQEKALAEALAKESAELQAEQQRLRAAREMQKATEIKQYTVALRRKVGQHWVDQGTWQGLETKLLVRLAPGGSVLDVSIVQSSGNIALDRSARAAIYKASPLPVPTDSELFAAFQEFQFTFRPDDLRIG